MPLLHSAAAQGSPWHAGKDRDSLPRTPCSGQREARGVCGSLVQVSWPGGLEGHAMLNYTLAPHPAEPTSCSRVTVTLSKPWFLLGMMPPRAVNWLSGFRSVTSNTGQQRQGKLTVMEAVSATSPYKASLRSVKQSAVIGWCSLHLLFLYPSTIWSAAAPLPASFFTTTCVQKVNGRSALLICPS